MYEMCETVQHRIAHEMLVPKRNHKLWAMQATTTTTIIIMFMVKPVNRWIRVWGLFRHFSVFTFSSSRSQLTAVGELVIGLVIRCLVRSDRQCSRGRDVNANDDLVAKYFDAEWTRSHEVHVLLNSDLSILNFHYVNENTSPQCWPQIEYMSRRTPSLHRFWSDVCHFTFAQNSLDSFELRRMRNCMRRR